MYFVSYEQCHCLGVNRAVTLLLVSYANSVQVLWNCIRFVFCCFTCTVNLFVFVSCGNLLSVAVVNGYWLTSCGWLTDPWFERSPYWWFLFVSRGRYFAVQKFLSWHNNNRSLKNETRVVLGEIDFNSHSKLRLPGLLSVSHDLAER